MKAAEAEFFPDVNLAAGFPVSTRSAGAASRPPRAVRSRSARRFTCRSSTRCPRSQLNGRQADFDLEVAHYNETPIDAPCRRSRLGARRSARSISNRRRITRARRITKALSSRRDRALRPGLSPQLQVLSTVQNRLLRRTDADEPEDAAPRYADRLRQGAGGGFHARNVVVPPDAAASAASRDCRGEPSVLIPPSTEHARTSDKVYVTRTRSTTMSTPRSPPPRIRLTNTLTQRTIRLLVIALLVAGVAWPVPLPRRTLSLKTPTTPT